ncbi:unnamed protein product [Gordionus sp. m RMFG-2023]
MYFPPASYHSNHSSNNKPFHSFNQIPSASHLPITIHHHSNPISLQDPYICISSSIIPFQSLDQQYTIPFIRPNPICLPFAHYHSSSSQSHRIARSIYMYFLQHHTIPNPIIRLTTYHSIHSTKSHLPPICPLPFIIIPILYNCKIHIYVFSSSIIPFQSFV